MQRMKKSRTAETIVMTKWTGLKGSSLIAGEKEDELLSCFSPYFVDTVKGFKNLLSTDIEEEVFGIYGADKIRKVGEGGIYGALWDLAEEYGTGITVYLKDIPIRQETIEIANFFEIDPYLLFSDGAYLVFTSRGYELTRALRERGLSTAMIGETTDSNDRVVINGGNRRFLSPRYKDEIHKIIKGDSYG